MADRLTCPICRRPVPAAAGERPESFPFCSRRCRLVDLGRWSAGQYVVAGQPVLDDGDAAPR